MMMFPEDFLSVETHMHELLLYVFVYKQTTGKVVPLAFVDRSIHKTGC